MSSRFRCAIAATSLLAALVATPTPLFPMTAKEFMEEKTPDFRTRELNQAFWVVVADRTYELQNRNDKDGSPKTKERLKRDDEEIAFLKDIVYNFDEARVDAMIAETFHKQPDTPLEDIVIRYVADAWNQHTKGVIK